MLSDHNASAIVAVRDLVRARTFYETVLGLTLVDGGGADASAPLVFRTGSTRLVVYASEFAGTNQANAVVWGVGAAIESLSADLKRKGVVFETYDMDGATVSDGVYRLGDFRMAWFKDPDGNILHINSGD